MKTYSESPDHQVMFCPRFLPRPFVPFQYRTVKGLACETKRSPYVYMYGWPVWHSTRGCMDIVVLDQRLIAHGTLR